MKSLANGAPEPAPAAPLISEVRYSLPDLLREVQLERNAAVFAMEKLDRTEISKLFQKNRTRRAIKKQQ